MDPTNPINTCHPQPDQPLPLDSGRAPEVLGETPPCGQQRNKECASEHRKSIWEEVAFTNDNLFVLVCLIQGDLQWAFQKKLQNGNKRSTTFFTKGKGKHSHYNLFSKICS